MRLTDIAKSTANYFFGFPKNQNLEPSKKYLFAAAKNGLNITEAYLALSILSGSIDMSEGVFAIGAIEAYRLIVNGMQLLDRIADDAEKEKVLSALD